MESTFFVGPGSAKHNTIDIKNKRETAEKMQNIDGKTYPEKVKLLMDSGSRYFAYGLII